MFRFLDVFLRRNGKGKPKYEEMQTFSKMGMFEIPRNVNLAEIKAPAGCFLTKGSFSEHTPDELIHFCYDLKK